MREGQYSFSAKQRDKHLIALADEYKIIAIQSGINFSRLVLDAMQYYKEQGKLPNVKS